MQFFTWSSLRGVCSKLACVRVCARARAPAHDTADSFVFSNSFQSDCSIDSNSFVTFYIHLTSTTQASSAITMCLRHAIWRKKKRARTHTQSEIPVLRAVAANKMRFVRIWMKKGFSFFFFLNAWTYASSKYVPPSQQFDQNYYL